MSDPGGSEPMADKNEVETPEDGQLDGDSISMRTLSIDEFGALLGENLTARAVLTMLTTRDPLRLPAAKGLLGRTSPRTKISFDSALTLDMAFEYACYLAERGELQKPYGVGCRTCSICLEPKVFRAPLGGIISPRFWGPCLLPGISLRHFTEFGPPPPCCRSVICNTCYHQGLARNINPGFIKDSDTPGPWIRCPSDTCSQRLNICNEAQYLRLLTDHGYTSREGGVIEFRNAVALREQMLRLQNLLPRTFSPEVLQISADFHVELMEKYCMNKLSQQDLGPKPEVELLEFTSKDEPRTLWVPVAVGLFRNRTSSLTIEDEGWCCGKCDICWETYIELADDEPEEDARFEEVRACFPGWHLPFRSTLSLPDCPCSGRLNVCRRCVDRIVESSLSQEEVAPVRCPGGCGQSLTDEDVCRLASRQVSNEYRTERYFLEHRDEIKECPKCGIIIGFLDACHEVNRGICSCGHEFCWECLANRRVVEARYSWYEWQSQRSDQRPLAEQRRAWLHMEFGRWLRAQGHRYLPVLWLGDQDHEWMLSEYRAWLRRHDGSTTTTPWSNGHRPHCSDYEQFR